MTNDDLEVMFFGSPGTGFSTYPSGKANLVTKFDKATKSYSYFLKYYNEKSGSKIVYGEYGLTGVGKFGGSRGGRNFGFVIELKGHSLTDIGINKLSNYLNGFITDGIKENRSFNIFTGNKNPLHYNILSFEEVDQELGKLLQIFKEDFLKEFEPYFNPDRDKNLADQVITLAEFPVDVHKSKFKNSPVLPIINKPIRETPQKGNSIKYDQKLLLLAGLLLISIILNARLLFKNYQLKYQVKSFTTSKAITFHQPYDSPLPSEPIIDKALPKKISYLLEDIPSAKFLRYDQPFLKLTVQAYSEINLSSLKSSDDLVKKINKLLLNKTKINSRLYNDPKGQRTSEIANSIKRLNIKELNEFNKNIGQSKKDISEILPHNLKIVELDEQGMPQK